ncbi:MAG TPA: GyrI-like domain-containing protein [Puia sp.]
MLIRTHPFMTVLYSSRQARLADLPLVSGTVARELYRYVADLDLLVCGPQYWFYPCSGDAELGKLPHPRNTAISVLPDEPPVAAFGGVDGRPDTRFTLEVALPVHGKIPTALLPYFKQIPAFRCLTSRYEGPWEGIGGHYEQMLQHIKENQLKMSGVYAESFLHIDIDHPDNHITEIQIGLC